MSQASQNLVLVPAEFMETVLSKLDRLEQRFDTAKISSEPEWRTLHDYADHVGKSLATVRRWRDRGQIQTRMEGKTEMVKCCA